MGFLLNFSPIVFMGCALPQPASKFMPNSNGSISS
jgi:hypothetical protein